MMSAAPVACVARIRQFHRAGLAPMAWPVRTLVQGTPIARRPPRVKLAVTAGRGHVPSVRRTFPAVQELARFRIVRMTVNVRAAIACLEAAPARLVCASRIVSNATRPKGGLVAGRGRAVWPGGFIYGGPAGQCDRRELAFHVATPAFLGAKSPGPVGRCVTPYTVWATPAWRVRDVAASEQILALGG